MTFKTNVPPIEINDTGVVIPTEESVLQGLLEDFNQAFGGNLNKNLDTPQGQLASSLAAIIADRDNQLARLMNQVNPDYAEGAMQDAIAKIYFLERKPETKAQAVCEFIGLAGVVIPKDYPVQDENGQVWRVSKRYVIGSSGTVSAVVTANSDVNARAGSISTMTQYINGLDRVSNPHDSIAGKPAESREDFKDRRQKSVAINSLGMPASVYANVAKLPGVTDVYVIDNPKGTAVEKNGYTLAPHSIFVAVNGGDNEEIAKTIWRYSGSGCDYNGNTAVTIYDDLYQDPKPSYEILFQRPEPVQVFFKVRVAKGAPLGYELKIQKTIAETFEKMKLSKIGATVYSADFFTAILQNHTDVRLLDIQVSDKRSGWREAVSVGISKIPSVKASNIEIVEDD